MHFEEVVSSEKGVVREKKKRGGVETLPTGVRWEGMLRGCITLISFESVAGARSFVLFARRMSL
jgi:hypothetical protein